VIDLASIEALPLAVAIRRSVWAYPILETVHIASFAVVFGALMLLELRVFGIARQIPLAPLARLTVPTVLVGFACAAVAGSLMLVSDATQVIPNPAFQIKMCLVLLAGLNAWWFHRRDSLERHDRTARLQAGASLFLWLGVITAGRMIAYV
jgi:hypothetical protein